MGNDPQGFTCFQAWSSAGGLVREGRGTSGRWSSLEEVGPWGAAVRLHSPGPLYVHYVIPAWRCNVTSWPPVLPLDAIHAFPI